MKNQIDIPDTTLHYIDSEWNKGSFIGEELMTCDMNNFAIDKNQASKIKSTFLKQRIIRYVNTGRIRDFSDDFSDCEHRVVCKNMETKKLALGEIYLNPVSNYEKKLKNLFVTGSVVFPNAEFETDSDIWKVVEKVYSFCKNKSIWFLARCFRTKNDFFPIIQKNSGSLVVCLLVNRKYKLADFPYTAIKQQMNGRNFTVKSTADSSKLHQREIVMRKIIVNFDTDFCDSNIKNETWQMSLLLSDAAYKQKESFVVKCKREQM